MKIIWTRRAYQSWLEAAQYIRESFGLTALRKFTDNTRKWEDTLASMPEIGSVEPLLAGMNKVYRSIVISKLNKLIYAVEQDCIKIYDFWDTRREPTQQAKNLNQE